MSVWLAKLLGPVILTLSLPMIVSPARLNETTRGFLNDAPLVLISGVLATTAGLAIVNTHNVWTFGWPVIVTLFGWALVFGGASRIVAPHIVSDAGSGMMGRTLVTRLVGTVWAVLGGFLAIKGYA